jgi:hypothetical protein
VDARSGGEAPRAAEMRLGTLLQLEAERAGRSADWRPYVTGRMLLPPGSELPFGLLAETVPPDRAAAETIAARWRVDPDVLWLVTRSALDLLARARSL